MFTSWTQARYSRRRVTEARRSAWRVGFAATEAPRERQEHHTEQRRVPADQPGDHERAGTGRDHQQDAEDHRRDTGKPEQPLVMDQPAEFDRRRDLDYAGDDRPRRDHEEQRERGDVRPRKGHDAGGYPEDTVEHEPPAAAADRDAVGEGGSEYHGAV